MSEVPLYHKLSEVDHIQDVVWAIFIHFPPETGSNRVEFDPAQTEIGKLEIGVWSFSEGVWWERAKYAQLAETDDFGSERVGIQTMA